VEDKTKSVRTQLAWILSLSLLILTFIFFQIDYTRFVPAGRFGGVSVGECAFEGLTIVGFGQTPERAILDLSAKKENYANLYCNGKFKDDPAELAIKDLGCAACKPDCQPKVSDEGGVVYGTAWDERSTASQKVSIRCK